MPAAGSAGFTDVDPHGSRSRHITTITRKHDRRHGLSDCGTVQHEPGHEGADGQYLYRALRRCRLLGRRVIDVDPHSAHAADINAIYAAGIATACSETPLRYCPDSDITRAQMASFLVGALNLA